MKWKIISALLLLSGFGGVRAQMPTDTMPDPSHALPYNQDSLRREMLLQKQLIAEKMAKADIQYFIIHADDHKYGYTVFIDGQLYIEQKSIPAVEGHAGFRTKEDAEKTAQLVIKKIREGEMPPTISLDDLKSLKVIE